MCMLDSVETFSPNQLPGSKDVDLVRPDRAGIVERQREVEEQENRPAHDTM